MKLFLGFFCMAIKYLNGRLLQLYTGKAGSLDLILLERYKQTTPLFLWNAAKWMTETHNDARLQKPYPQPQCSHCSPDNQPPIFLWPQYFLLLSEISLFTAVTSSLCLFYIHTCHVIILFLEWGSHISLQFTMYLTMTLNSGHSVPTSQVLGL